MRIEILMILLFILGFCFLISYILNDQYKKRQSYIINFEHYAVILDYHLKKAFDIIYKDRILIYSLEATKINDQQFKVTTFDFIKLVLKLIGPTLQKEFIFLYGSEETFYFNLTEYFNTRFEDDEIRKTSMTTLMETEVDEQMSYKMGDIG